MIHVGVAGWDYADWEGPVYPPGAGKGFDRLLHVARFVDVIEINSTFYRPAAPRTAASWARRIESLPTFRFAAKAHRGWTHDRMADLDDTVASTLEGLAPLLEANRLLALLLQFPQSFDNTDDSLAHLDRLIDRAGEWPLCVELRHHSWGVPEAVDWFRRRSVAWCVVDQPRIGTSTLGPEPRVTAPLAYLRLHGRNATDWFRPGAGRDARYDYRYEEGELRALADVAGRLDESAEQLVVIQNNHFRGQALANAIQMKSLLQPGRPVAPGRLVDTYPDLRDHVKIERDTLF